MTNEQLGHIILRTLESKRFVVLPNVGAFLLRKVPARINAVQDRIDPPKEIIRFNVSILEDEGLLTSAISKHLGLPIEQARMQMTDSVSRIRFELTKDAEANLGALGSLVLKSDKTLMFQEHPDHHIWPDHFGLPSLQLHELPQSKKAVLKQLMPKTQGIPVGRIAAYAASLALVVTLGIIPLSNENNRNRASLSIADLLGKEVKVHYTPRSFVPMQVSASYVSDGPNYNSETTTVSEVPVEVEIPEITVEEEPKEYFVIAGGFATQKEAEQLASDLASRGFGGTYVGKFDEKHLVSYGSYSSLEDAKGMKASVAMGNPDAWVLAGR